MIKKLILIGGGGHCRSCIDVIELENKYKIIAIIDLKEKIDENILGYKIIDSDENIEQYIASDIYFFISLGQIKTSEKRIALFNYLKEKNANIATIISPLAYVSKHSTVGIGTLIMHYAQINAGVSIGENCIINSKTLIEHDVVVEDNCHISTGTIVNGNVIIGRNTFVESNAVVEENINTASNEIIDSCEPATQCSNEYCHKKYFTIGYFADGIWGHNAFNLINNNLNFSIKFICPRFDTEDDVLEKMAKANNIDYIKHQNINSEDFLNQIQKYDCDILVSMSFNQIFKKSILNKYQIINCHAGKLPFYRGRNILNWVLINDEKEFGITVHFVDEGIDTGDIILQRTYPISDKDNYKSLLEKAYKECPSILEEALVKIKNGCVNIIKQKDIHPVGMYCGIRNEGDERINWNLSSRNLFNFIRALSKPAPMAKSTLNGIEIFINSAEIISEAPKYIGIPGQILYKENKALIIKTIDSIIMINEFFYSGKIKIGDRLI